MFARGNDGPKLPKNLWPNRQYQSPKTRARFDRKACHVTGQPNPIAAQVESPVLRVIAQRRFLASLEHSCSC
ncbi:hypothetical protein N9N20_03970 [Planktomarina temperata]|nr:hypothetical protein [Planktomarina temperata]MDA9900529.1 hypothetical protein [Planktomarina temperata]